MWVGFVREGTISECFGTPRDDRDDDDDDDDDVPVYNLFFKLCAHSSRVEPERFCRSGGAADKVGAHVRSISTSVDSSIECPPQWIPASTLPVEGIGAARTASRQLELSLHSSGFNFTISAASIFARQHINGCARYVSRT